MSTVQRVAEVSRGRFMSPEAQALLQSAMSAKRAWVPDWANVARNAHV